MAHQSPPSMGFFKQEYWSGLPFPSPGDLPNPGIKPRSPTLQADSLPSEPPGKPPYISWPYIYKRNLIHNLKSYYPDTKPHKDITKKMKVQGYIPREHTYKNLQQNKQTQ